MAQGRKTAVDRAREIEPRQDLEQRLVKSDRAVKKLRAENVSLRRKYEQAVAELDEWEERIEIVEAVESSRGSGRAIKRIKGGSSSKSTPILVMCDWHSEEQVDPEVVNRVNEYNLTIAERRIKRAFAKGLELIDAWRRTWPMEDLVLALLGDHITGYIHEELVENNYLSPVEAVLFCSDMIHDGLEFLKTEGGFKHILVATAHGNHGRTTTKKRISTSYKNSFEWGMYGTLSRAYRNDPQVIWNVTKGYHNWVDVQGRRVRLHHGDGLRYNGGVGGISIPVNKSVAQWNKVERADLDLFGHWHTFLDTWNWVSCGCAIGYNAYSVEIKADYQPPSQTLVIMNRERGKVAAMPVFLE